MPIGVTRYKNNKYFKTEKGAFGGRVRLFSKKDSTPYEPLICRLPNKVKKQVQMISELRITVNTNQHKIMEDNSSNIETRVKLIDKLEKNSVNFNNNELRINTSDTDTSFLKRNYTECTFVPVKHINRCMNILPNETLIRTSSIITNNLYKDLSECRLYANHEQYDLLVVSVKNNKPIKFFLNTVLGELVVRLSFNRHEQIKINKKFIGVSKRTFNQRSYNDNLFRFTKKYGGENKIVKRGISVEGYKAENLNKDVFSKQFNITRKTEENVKIVRRGMLASKDDLPCYEKGELLGIQTEYFDLPVYNENKFEHDSLQITVPHVSPAMVMTFEFVSPVISTTSEAESIPVSSSDVLNRVVIEAQKQNYIRFNVQLNNTTINKVTNLPAGFNFDKFGIFGSSNVAGTFTGEIQLVNGNSFPYLLKIHNIKRLQ